MPISLETAAFVLFGFLLGSVPFGYLFGRLLHGEDIREHGSGNIGMTNVWRNYGAAEGLSCFVLDVGKGLVPALLYMQLMQDSAALSAEAVAIGLAAVFGHVFTPWLGFDGGKGIATGLGVATAWLGVWVLVPVGVFAVTVALGRMVSLGSILGALGFAAVCWFGPENFQTLRWVALFIAGFILWTHRENIRRILRGEESKIGGGDGKNDASGSDE